MKLICLYYNSLSQPKDILLQKGLQQSSIDILTPLDPRIPQVVRTRPSGSYIAFAVGELSVLILQVSPEPLQIELFYDGVPTVSLQWNMLLFILLIPTTHYNFNSLKLILH